MNRVGAVPQPVLERAVYWFAGGIENLAVYIVYPAVIAASDSAFLNDAELERRASVGAIEREEADAIRLIFELSKILAEHPNANRYVIEVRSKSDGVPKSS